MRPVKVGLLGLGTVGGGTVNVLSRNQEEIARRAGRGIRITHAAARETNFPGVDIESITVSQDAFAVVDHPEPALQFSPGMCFSILVKECYYYIV